MPPRAYVPYPSVLSDREWAVLATLLPRAKPGGQPRTVDLRSILNGIFYVLRSGCQWRMLPRRFGPWSTVYACYRARRIDGVWERIHTMLQEQVRRQAGRESTPSAAILDSQSVKTTERGGPHGYDGAKKLSGRKRHLLVDTLGLALGVFAHPADIQDRASAPWLLRLLQSTRPRLEVIWADSASLGPLSGTAAHLGVGDLGLARAHCRARWQARGLDARRPGAAYPHVGLPARTPSLDCGADVRLDRAQTGA